MGLPPELERIVAHEDQEMRPHQEETALVDLGIGSGKKEVKIGMGMTAPIHGLWDELLPAQMNVLCFSLGVPPSNTIHAEPYHLVDIQDGPD